MEKMEKDDKISGLPPVVVSVIEALRVSMLANETATEKAVDRFQSLLFEKVAPKPEEIETALFESEEGGELD